MNEQRVKDLIEELRHYKDATIRTTELVTLLKQTVYGNEPVEALLSGTIRDQEPLQRPEIYSSLMFKEYQDRVKRGRLVDCSFDMFKHMKISHNCVKCGATEFWLFRIERKESCSPGNLFPLCSDCAKNSRPPLYKSGLHPYDWMAHHGIDWEDWKPLQG